ncbi:hypothetical protein JCM10207_006402 [Rhodosporidiobolus poonsookiae]
MADLSLPPSAVPAAAPTPSSHPFDPLLSLEESFYQRGYASGLPHGELHGFIEGRELGREKAWEIWEEIGYAEGVGRLWKGVLQMNGKDSGRPAQSLEQLLALVDAFPTSNDSSSLTQPSSSPSSPSSPASAGDSTEAELDIPALLSALRGKYRTACASLGVRPRMVAAGAAGAEARQTQANGDGLEGVRQASLVV